MRNMPKLNCLSVVMSCPLEEKKKKKKRGKEEYDDEEKKKNWNEDVECTDWDKQQTDRNAIPPFLDPLTYVEMDAAGPVFDKQSMRILYNLCHKHTSNNDHTKGRYSIMDNLQPTHLHSIGLSNNLATTLALPTTVACMVLQTIVPSVYLKRKLIALAEDIILDDIALIEEDQISTDCMGLMDEEVLEACWIRGLPVGRFVTVNNNVSGSACRSGTEDEVQIMRRVLKNHLQMMEAIMACRSDSGCARGDTSTSLCSRSELVRDSTLLLLVLHLPAIRYRMREESMRQH